MNEHEAKLMYALLMCGGKWPEGIADIGAFKDYLEIREFTSMLGKGWVRHLDCTVTPKGLEALKQYEERNKHHD